jgi:hypothetical protein
LLAAHNGVVRLIHHAHRSRKIFAPMQIFNSVCAHHNAAAISPQTRPNPERQCSRNNKKIRRRCGIGMTELQRERLAKERAEIAARVARFKATQEKFEREREEYFVTTLRKACASGPLPVWL